MIVLQIIVGLFLMGLALSVFGFILNVILAFIIGGWSIASAIVCRLRYGTWDKPEKEVV